MLPTEVPRNVNKYIGSVNLLSIPGRDNWLEEHMLLFFMLHCLVCYAVPSFTFHRNTFMFVSCIHFSCDVDGDKFTTFIHRSSS